MLDSFNAPASDPWGRVFEVLFEYSVDYDRQAPGPWRFREPVSNGYRDRGARFQELEAAVVEEVEQGVELLIANQPIDHLSDRAKYWLGVRVDACILFASWLSTPDNLLVPQKSLEELVRWILITWWHKHGASFTTNLDDGRFPGSSQL